MVDRFLALAAATIAVAAAFTELAKIPFGLRLLVVVLLSMVVVWRVIVWRCRILGRSRSPAGFGVEPRRRATSWLLGMILILSILMLAFVALLHVTTVYHTIVRQADDASAFKGVELKAPRTTVEEVVLHLPAGVDRHNCSPYELSPRGRAPLQRGWETRDPELVIRDFVYPERTGVKCRTPIQNGRLTVSTRPPTVAVLTAEDLDKYNRWFITGGVLLWLIALFAAAFCALRH